MMRDSLRHQLSRHTDRLGELDFLLAQPDVMADMAQFMKLSREHTEVAAVAGRWARYLQREQDLAAAREMLADPDMAELAREEIAAAEAELTELEAELQRMLLPKDPMTRATPSSRSARARAVMSRPCSRVTWRACTRVTRKAKAGAWR